MKSSLDTKLKVIPYLFIFISVIVSSILLVLFYEKYFNQSLDANFNTFCQDQDGKPQDQNTLNYLICFHSMKRKSFLWLQLDGFSFDQLDQIKQEISKDALILKSVGPVYRQSGAMHESYFTGRVSRNFIGDAIKGDNLAYQIKQSRSQKPMKFIGTFFPLQTLIHQFMNSENLLSGEDGILLSLCGTLPPESSKFNFLKRTANIDNFDLMEAGVHFDYEHLLNLLEKQFPQILEQEEFNEKLIDCLQSGELLNSQNQTIHSTIYYSAYTDTLNHAFSKRHAYNVYSYYKLNLLIIQVIKLFRERLPDVALFISSDHGGQYFNGEDNFCNHGCIHENNHGILIISTPETVGHGKIDNINFLDVTPTVAQFLENVNLPLFNNGQGYPLRKGDFEYEILPLHQRYVQLSQYFEKIEGQKFNDYDEFDEFNMSQKYNNILSQQLSPQGEQQILNEYRTTISKLQELVEKSQMKKKDYRLIIILEAILVVGILVLFVTNSKKMRIEYSLLNRNQIILLVLIGIMIFSDNILILWQKQRGDSFFQDSFILTIAILGILLALSFLFDFTKLSLQQLYALPQNYLANQHSTYKKIENANFDQFSSPFSLPVQRDDDKSSKRKLLFKILFSTPQLLIKVIQKKLTIRRCLALIFILEIFCYVCIQQDLFIKAKQFYMETVNKINSFTFFNYSIFILFYFSPRAQEIKINRFQIVFYICTFMMMIMYDIIDLRYLIRKTPFEVFMCRLITVVIFMSLIYNYYRAYQLLQDNKIFTQTRLPSHRNIKIDSTTFDHVNLKPIFIYLLLDFSVFIFFLADEIERFYLIILFFSFAFLSRTLLKLLNAATHLENQSLLVPFINHFLIVALFFKNNQIIYSAFKGTLSLDINLQSGNKSIGSYQDETPIYTAVMFGIDKMMVFEFGYIEVTCMLLKIFLLNGKIQFDQQSKTILIFILIKIMISGLQQYFHFFNDSSFLSLFMWNSSMSVIAIVTLIPYGIIQTICCCCRKE